MGWGQAGAQSQCRCGRGEPGPGADEVGVSPVPVPMWLRRAQSRCRCGRTAEPESDEILPQDFLRINRMICGRDEPRLQRPPRPAAVRCGRRVRCMRCAAHPSRTEKQTESASDHKPQNKQALWAARQAPICAAGSEAHAVGHVGDEGI